MNKTKLFFYGIFSSFLISNYSLSHSVPDRAVNKNMPLIKCFFSLQILEDMRADLVSVWDTEMWPNILKNADIFDLSEISVPRRACKQTARSNIPGEPKEYYRVKLDVYYELPTSKAFI